METLKVEPRIGIGAIKLGMCKKDVEDLIQTYSKQFESSPYFRLEYTDNGKANFIEVTSGIENCYTSTFNGIDVFNPT